MKISFVFENAFPWFCNAQVEKQTYVLVNTHEEAYKCKEKNVVLVASATDPFFACENLFLCGCDIMLQNANSTTLTQT